MKLLQGALCATACALTCALRPGNAESAGADEVVRKVLRSLADVVALAAWPAEEAAAVVPMADGSGSLIDLHTAAGRQAGHHHRQDPAATTQDLAATTQDASGVPLEKVQLEAKNKQVFDEMKVVCRDPPTEKEPITSKDTLAMLRKCVTGIKSYIDVTKMFQKKSFMANKRHKEEVDKVVEHLGELENYVAAVHAFNKDHSKAKDDLLKLSEELEANISNLLLPKTLAQVKTGEPLKTENSTAAA